MFAVCSNSLRCVVRRQQSSRPSQRQPLLQPLPPRAMASPALPCSAGQGPLQHQGHATPPSPARTPSSSSPSPAVVGRCMGMTPAQRLAGCLLHWVSMSTRSATSSWRGTLSLVRLRATTRWSLISSSPGAQLSRTMGAWHTPGASISTILLVGTLAAIPALC
jgi:hypothetical protein